ncbi:hypothetical protein PNBC_02625 [Paenibacillus crassostreae]|uniref:Uncharacterized protein n=1 Tax=Paenibacillus crassostreae TaxID=1763538 RepID=A0A167F9N7_9BACL|nr:hypothetical protein [Paenibacillus crassostreae]AOZ90902.1 hypothetical protein LPB68_00900 [Paenibacillus crassostreae]OAB76331.1 hypothetical protein PNBC_02625 [Paenibacillus crassostreae]
MLKSKKQNQFVFYTIKGSTIKKFLILDLVTGSVIYFAVKIIYSSILIATVGSIIGTEGIKKISKFQKKSLKFKL